MNSEKSIRHKRILIHSVVFTFEYIISVFDRFNSKNPVPVKLKNNLDSMNRFIQYNIIKYQRYRQADSYSSTDTILKSLDKTIII